jgi:hypothetical protein
MKLYKILLILLILQACRQISINRKNDLWVMVKSNNVDSIIDATIEIQEAKDTSMFSAILYKPDDPRITNNLKYKGLSVYQIKMQALKLMTGLNPPKQITYNIDTTIINFYRNKLNQ